MSLPEVGLSIFSHIQPSNSKTSPMALISKHIILKAVKVNVTKRNINFIHLSLYIFLKVVLAVTETQVTREVS